MKALYVDVHRAANSRRKNRNSHVVYDGERFFKVEKLMGYLLRLGTGCS